MTEPAEELPEGWVRCEPIMWIDEFWAKHEDSETRQGMREAMEECEEEP
jgi:hypothetical protein